MTRTNSFGLAILLALILVASAAVVVTRALETPGEASQSAEPEESAEPEGSAEPERSAEPEGPAEPEEEGDSPPTADEIAHAGDRLAANGFEVSDEVLTELASKYGVGGAVRIVAWSQADPDRMADLRVMRDGDGSEGSGMGWGQIAKELGVHPGIGSIMGNGGDHEKPNGWDEDH